MISQFLSVLYGISVTSLEAFSVPSVMTQCVYHGLTDFYQNCLLNVVV